jgi:hypothetical protein
MIKNVANTLQIGVKIGGKKITTRSKTNMFHDKVDWERVGAGAKEKKDSIDGSYEGMSSSKE